MQIDWVKIYSSDKFHKVEIVKAVLEDNGIVSFEINMKDSANISAGEVELYVKAEDEILAKVIIINNKL